MHVYINETNHFKNMLTLKHQKYGKESAADMHKMNSYWVGLQTSSATTETEMEVPQNTKHRPNHSYYRPLGA